jgi:hypothetical protein
MSVARAAQPVPDVAVDDLSEVLLIRGVGEAAEPFAALVAALPVRAAEVCVLVSASVSGRSDLVDILQREIAIRFGGVAADVRLILLGARDDQQATEVAVRSLAARVGQAVHAPLGRLSLAAGGVIAAGAGERVPGGWLRCDAFGVATVTGPWHPEPSWAAGLPPTMSHLRRFGAVTIQPVAAGLWLRPDRADQAGAGERVTPDPDRLTLVIGGAVPMPAADVTELLRTTALPPHTRFLLLPGAVDPATDLAALRSLLRATGEVTGGVAGRAATGEPILARVTGAGRPAWSREPGLAGGAVASRPATSRPEQAGRPARRRDGWSEPAEVAALPPASGRPTAAGWSFAAEPVSIGVAPVLTGFVVEVEFDKDGFVVAGDPIDATGLAAMIRACPGFHDRPVALVPHGLPPDSGLLREVAGQLAHALRTAVYAADAEVSVTANGLIHTSGEFARFDPIEEAGILMLGGVLPPLPIVRASPGPQPDQSSPGPPDTVPTATVLPGPEPVAVSGLARTLLATQKFLTGEYSAITAGGTAAGEVRVVAAPAAGPVVGPQPAASAGMAATQLGSVARELSGAIGSAVTVPAVLSRQDLERDPLPGAARPAADSAADHRRADRPANSAGSSGVAAPAARPRPVWLQSDAWRAEDATALRRALNGRYDVSARMVTRTLSEQPGLRAGGVGDELMAGLVAVRAYSDGGAEAVNEALRAGATDDSSLVVARCMAHGLRRLPVALGAVYRTVLLTPSQIRAYRSGLELVEPGFVDVSTSSGAAGAAGEVVYLIWSTSARRLDRLGAGSTSQAVFPPRSRFRVLAVALADDGRQQVMLRDLGGSARHGGDDARVIDRLTHGARSGPVGSVVSTGVGGPAIGLDADGRPFVGPDEEESSR